MCLSAFPFLQVSMQTFANEKELRDWVQDKTHACVRPDKPDRLHANYHLCEFWYHHDKGCDMANDKVTKEEVGQDATDLSGGLAMLGVDGKPNKRQKQSLDDQHRSTNLKFTLTSNKLAKAMGLSDSSMPTYKRSWPVERPQGGLDGLSPHKGVLHG